MPIGWSRRRWLAAAAGLSFAARPALGEGVLRFATTPVFLDDEARSLARWQRYLEARLGQPVAFVQRANYREITDLLLANAVDCAWICGFPYVRQRAALQLVAVPLYRRAPLYHSYIIVPRDDAASRSLTDLGGRVFAYSDPDSNSGWLAPNVALRDRGFDPTRFFRRSFFTWGHRKVIQAVAVGLAQGGAVDGYVWDTLARKHAELTGATRIVERFGPFGFPPVVARRDHPAAAAVRRVLTAMAGDAEGRTLLDALNLDGFVAGDTHLHDGIEANWRRL
jgi:phosphonate transport system substrate-binding protein